MRTGRIPSLIQVWCDHGVWFTVHLSAVGL